MRKEYDFSKSRKSPYPLAAIQERPKHRGRIPIVGTDWVCLFDKQLCDYIIGLPLTALASFVELRRSEFPEYSEIRSEFPDNLPAADRIRILVESGEPLAELKSRLVDSLCVSNDVILLDYWACYAEVFGVDPPGSIPDYKLFPHVKEQRYLLLEPSHVDKMLASLDAHSDEVTIMQTEKISLLRKWRDDCANDPNRMVAYFYDY